MEELKVLLSKKDISIEYFIKNFQLNYDFLLNNLLEELKDFLCNEYFYIENISVYYDKRTVALFPIFKNYLKKDLQRNVVNVVLGELDYFAEGNGLEWDFLTSEEVKKSFSHNVDHPCKFGEYYLKFAEYNASYLSYKHENKISFYYTFSNSYNEESGSLIGIHRLKTEDAEEISDREMLTLWLQNALIPEGLVGKGRDAYFNLLQEFKEYKIIYNENGKIISFDYNKVVDAILNKKFPVSGEVVADKLLNVDTVRIGKSPYGRERVFDPNYGHWDIFPEEKPDDYYTVRVDEQLYYRDPRNDIRDGGAIGIDFGSRSCVVAFQEENDYTLPFIFGKNIFSRKNIYENASALRVNNLDKFLSEYNSEVSRPHTSWDDISIPTLEDLNSHSENIISDLYGSSNEKVDFVEIYAYYIGSFVNNMDNGIYLDYVLSFSPLESNERKNKILESFKRGIKKSLPYSILKDKEIMERLNIGYGASSGTALAISSISQNALSPKDDEVLLFGAFDMGANATDFSFGFVRGSNKRKHDYILEDFEVYGDEDLGGEKLLQEMTMEVFKNNLDIINEHSIKLAFSNFYSKNLLSTYKNSEETYYNMITMSNALRAYVENPEEINVNYPNGTLRVTLMNDKKELVPNIKFNINFQSLDSVGERITEVSLTKFFSILNKIFNRVQSYVKCKEVNIFIGGNGSKNKYLNKSFEKILASEMSKSSYKYKLYVLNEQRDFSKANRKTAVAFGVLNSKVGGRIKLIHRDYANTMMSESNFGYFVGYNNKGKFKCVLHPNSNLDQWEELFEADEEIFEIYYTKVTEAATNTLDILKTQRKRIRVDRIKLDHNIYIRPKSKNIIEYVIATPEGIKEKVLIDEIKLLDLSE
ncbi:hypothetical protein [Fusobacterium sp. PH5-44]|uniref:hypothetical protein n=1 Tax=unclassified Fusobacterium TaxID=2648384 RepID=UPI003D1EA644